MPLRAVQEERLSRHKNDAAFPLAALNIASIHAGLEPDDLDAVVFYERPMLNSTAFSPAPCAPFPSPGVFSACMKNSPGRETVGARHHLVASGGGAGVKILFTDHHALMPQRPSFTAPVSRCRDIDCGWGGRMGGADGGAWHAWTGQDAITFVARIRFPHSLECFIRRSPPYLGFRSMKASTR